MPRWQTDGVHRGVKPLLLSSLCTRHLTGAPRLPCPNGRAKSTNNSLTPLKEAPAAGVLPLPFNLNFPLQRARRARHIRFMGQNSDPGAGAVSPATRAVRWSGGLSCALVAAGIGVRVYQWALNRSLWLDEAYLAVNLVERDLVGLLRPLEYDQSAPYLFLAATDLLVSVFGYDERVLRLLPLVASSAALVLFWRLLARTAAPAVVPLGVGIFALSYPLVFYAQELKQYAVEVFLVVWVLYLLVRLLETGRGGGARGWGTLWSVGAVGLFASHTLPFCLAGVGLVLAWERWGGRIGVAWSALIAGGAAWALLFAVNYVLFIRPNYDNPFMRDYWAFAHPGAPWTLQGLKAWKELTSVYIGYVGFHNFRRWSSSQRFCWVVAWPW